MSRLQQKAGEVHGYLCYVILCYGMEWNGMVCMSFYVMLLHYGMARNGTEQYDRVWNGMAWYGLVWHVYHVMEWNGMEWNGFV